MKIKKCYAPGIIILLIMCLENVRTVNGQVCANPADVIYGQTIAADIHPISVSTGAVSAKLNPAYTGNAPSLANSIGYNSLNGRFYYFKRNFAGAPQEFVSFDPATNLYAILASSPMTSISRSGCTNASGTGFYCVDSSSNLCYYNIATDSWTIITSTIFNQFGSNVSASFSARKSGDMAIDGNGNLWIIISGAGFYGLYRVDAPLPTTSVASITATELIPPSTPTPGGLSFTGIAFNATGQIFLVTSTGTNFLYRLENDLSLTFLLTMTGVDGMGNDLTSCNFPMNVLPVVWQNFTASITADAQVLLTWGVVGENGQDAAYYVEQSHDGVHWQTIGTATTTAANARATKYTFTDKHPLQGQNYYRARVGNHHSSTVYSPVRRVAVENGHYVKAVPNPASHVIIVTNGGNNQAVCHVMDLSGRVVMQSLLHAGNNTLNISTLRAGMYMLRVLAAGGQDQYQSFIKQ